MGFFSTMFESPFGLYVVMLCGVAVINAAGARADLRVWRAMRRKAAAEEAAARRRALGRTRVEDTRVEDTPRDGKKMR